MPAAETGLHRNDIEVGFLSHVGMVRTENQDSFGFFEPASEDELRGKGRFLVVCDGMGGHNGGSIASRTTVDAMLEAISTSSSQNQQNLLSSSILHANQAVRNKGRNDPELRNMGTTCVAAAARGNRMEIAHVGDSRAYLFRGETYEQITRDHTYLNDLIDIGLLTPELAKNHPERNIITRCVGMSDELQVEFNTREVKPGDVFLLCSDGLYNHVEDDEMRDAVVSMEAQQACQVLVDLANKRGGEDNITVAVLKVNEIPAVFQGVNQGKERVGDDAAGSVTANSPEVDSDTEADEVTPRNSTPVLPVSTLVGEVEPVKGGSRLLRGLGVLIGVELILLIVLQVLISRY